jgi:hypothetical protein
VGPGHGLISRRIIQQAAGLGHDVGAVGANQLGRARLHSLGALSGSAQHQHRFSQRWCLLLQAPRIAQHQGGAAHRRHQLVVIEGFHQEGPRMVAEQGLQRFAHGGIAMQGQQQGRIGIELEQLKEAAADVLEALTPVFTPVHRGQNHPLLLKIEAGQGVGGRLLGHQQQGIDHRIAGGQHRAHHP